MRKNYKINVLNVCNMNELNYEKGLFISLFETIIQELRKY